MTRSTLPATRDERFTLATTLIGGVLTSSDTLVTGAMVSEDVARFAVDVATFERGIVLRNAIADAVFCSGFPALTTHSPIPLSEAGGAASWRLIVEVHLGCVEGGS